jgi:hypothetical protein
MDQFPATIKLVTGEEIFALVTPHKENNKEFLLLYEPVVITEIKTVNGDYGYKIVPWLKTADDDTFLITRDKILTLSECRNVNTINYHMKYIHRKYDESIDNPYEEKLNKEQGYLCNTNIMRNKLEELI